jgi:hypothetical protein
MRILFDVKVLLFVKVAGCWLLVAGYWCDSDDNHNKQLGTSNKQQTIK